MFPTGNKSKYDIVAFIGILPVITEPFSPKLTPLLLSNVMADRLVLDVPALTLMFVSPPPPAGTEIITVPSTAPTLATPAPEKTILEALMVPLVEEVVLPIAKTLFS